MKAKGDIAEVRLEDSITGVFMLNAMRLIFATLIEMLLMWEWL